MNSPAAASCSQRPWRAGSRWATDHDHVLWSKIQQTIFETTDCIFIMVTESAFWLMDDFSFLLLDLFFVSQSFPHSCSNVFPINPHLCYFNPCFCWLNPFLAGSISCCKHPNSCWFNPLGVACCLYNFQLVLLQSSNACFNPKFLGKLELFTNLNLAAIKRADFHHIS